jgi:hypothetical protein
MIALETKHSLSSSEIQILRSLIGQTITFIHCASIQILLNQPLYEFTDTIYIQTSNIDCRIALSGEFDETKLGEDFIKIKIDKTKVGMINHLGTEQAFSSLNISPNFTVSAIDVYGFSYQISSENSKPNPVFVIEKENMGTPITENIETENILIFYSTDNRRLLIRLVGAVPFIFVSLDDKIIEKQLFVKNLKGEIITKVKMLLK